MDALLTSFALGLPTLLLAVHVVSVTIRSRARPQTRAGVADVTALIDVRRVGLGFAVCLVSVALGRTLADHDRVGGVSLASLATFCAVIAWGLWGYGTRTRRSPALILLATAAAGFGLGIGAPSW